MTSDELEKLHVALDSAVLVAQKARSADWGLFFQTIVLRDDPNKSPPELLQLYTLLKSIASLEHFSSARQQTLSYGEKVNFLFLLTWLISRAQQVGTLQTIQDLSKYLISSSIEIKEILAFDGVEVDQSIILGEYELVNWKDVAQTDTKYSIAVRGLYSQSEPTAALVRKHHVDVKYYRPCNTLPYAPFSIEPSLDILRCLTAIVGCGYKLQHYWFEPPEWAAWKVPFSNFGVDNTRSSLSKSLEVDFLPELLLCVHKFSQMDENQKQRYRLPLDRLNLSYLKDFTSVDSVIELGIALESVYAPQKISEGIGFAIRQRAARFLGDTQVYRQEISDILKKTYDLRSRAVHSGRFDAGKTPSWMKDLQKTREVIKQGQKVVGKSLLKMIQLGEPDWEKFDIGND
jgi:Apea-like HEPN